jgi:hypothetical protein
MEKWTRVAGFPTYQVSDQGRVRGPQGLMAGTIELQNGKPRSVRVTLSKDGRDYYRRIHALVLQAFLGPRPEGLEACHNDGNPLNNCTENLRWDTRLANQHDSIRHGTHSKPPTHSGERHPRATISDRDVEAIRSMPYSRGLYSSLAREHGVAPITIRRIYKRTSRIFQ